MRFALVCLCALAAAPLAHADSIFFATDQVPVPTHVIQTGVDGHGTKVLASARALDVAADGAIVSGEGPSLLVDGRVVATAGWPVDNARFSADGTLLAFTAESLVKCGPAATNCATWELWIVKRDGSDLRRVSPDGRFPRFSPNGRWLAFLGGYAPDCDCGTVVVENVATGKRTWLEQSSSPPDFAPDGRTIGYSSQRYIRVGTWSPRRIRTLAVGAAPVFSTDGRLVAYTSPRGLVVESVDGRHAHIVGEHESGAYAWSKNGWLVYGTSPSRYPDNTELLRVRADGTHRARVRQSNPVTYLDWLRVYGTSIVFETTRTRWSAATIDSLDLQTGALTLLTHDLGDDRSPAFSPSGVLAYAKGSSTRFGWYCLSVAARCETTAATIDGIQDPAWSPDGRSIVVTSRHELQLVDTATSGVRLLHTFSGNVSSPTWSPDGHTIAVSAPASDYHLHVWLVDVKTGAASLLDTGDVGTAPSWSPDGTQIAFGGGTWGGPYALELYTVATGSSAPLVALGAQPVSSRPAWSPDATRLAYQAGDDSLHVIGRTGTSDRQVVPSALPGSALAWRP